MSAPTHLFVYGTLRPSLGHPASYLLDRITTPLGPASVRASLFDLGRYPGVVLDADGGEVRGEVVDVNPDAIDDLLRRLDAYEGVEYERVVAEVTGDDDRVVRAWIYVLVRVPAHARRIASGDWVSSTSTS